MCVKSTYICDAIFPICYIGSINTKYMACFLEWIVNHGWTVESGAGLSNAAIMMQFSWGKRLGGCGLVCMVTSPLIILRLHEAASFYQRALLANALTSALRLHQRLPHFQLSRAFLAQALVEDSCHYLLYSLIFVNSYPVTSILYPRVFSVLQFQSNVCKSGVEATLRLGLGIQVQTKNCFRK